MENASNTDIELADFPPPPASVAKGSAKNSSDTDVTDEEDTKTLAVLGEKQSLTNKRKPPIKFTEHDEDSSEDGIAYEFSQQETMRRHMMRESSWDGTVKKILSKHNNKEN